MIDFTDAERRLAIQRLTALWALNESGLGGVMHLINSPLTGLFVGGLAILLISLIGYFADEKSYQQILTALVIVLIVKAAVSPHSQPTAYIAVTFQAFLGILLFKIKNIGNIKYYIFGVIGLLESALQKLLVLTLLYGNPLWEAIDAFGIWLSKKGIPYIPDHSSSALIYTYLSTYIVGGILLGYTIRRVISMINRRWNESAYAISFSPDPLSKDSHKINRNKYKSYIITGIIIITFGTFYFYIDPTQGWSKAWKTLIRAAAIIVGWYLIIAPILIKFIHRLLNLQKSKMSHEVQDVFDIIPYLKQIIKVSWQQSSSSQYLKRYTVFISSVLLYSLKFKRTDS